MSPPRWPPSPQRCACGRREAPGTARRCRACSEAACRCRIRWLATCTARTKWVSAAPGPHPRSSLCSVRAVPGLRLCPAPAVLGLRCPQPRWSSGVSRRHPDSHWPPLSPPRQFQASRSLSQLSPALLSPLWRSPASHPGHSCPRFFCSLPVSSQPPLFSTPGIFNLEFPAPVVLRVSPRPPSSGVGSRAPPGTATGFWWRGEACLFAPGKASVDWRRRC